MDIAGTDLDPKMVIVKASTIDHDTVGSPNLVETVATIAVTNEIITVVRDSFACTGTLLELATTASLFGAFTRTMNLEAAVIEIAHRALVFFEKPCSAIHASSTTLHSSSCFRRRRCCHLGRLSGLDCWAGISAASCDVVSDLFPYTIPKNVASSQGTCFWHCYWIANPYSSRAVRAASVDCSFERGHWLPYRWATVIFDYFFSYAWCHYQYNKKDPCSLVHCVNWSACCFHWAGTERRPWVAISILIAVDLNH